MAEKQRDLHKEDPERYSDPSSDEDETDGAAGGSDAEEMLRKMMQLKLGVGGEGEKKLKPKVLDSLDLDGIVSYIKSGKAKKIVTMAGAGISTSAGIPDFRSPGTGLYDNLQEYNLPDPQAVFDISFFRGNPAPFYKLAKSLYPEESKFKPTPCHHFIKLLADKGLLLRHYTQNIDTLERLAGLSDELLIEAHGTFHSAHCTDNSCKKEYSQEWVKGKMFDDDVIPTCTECNSVVKPDIVFFGENLPQKFFQHVHSDFKECDLLIIMGTSLMVQPFAGLIHRVGPECPRLLINLEKAGEANAGGLDYLSRLLSGMMGEGLVFDTDEAYRDVALLGTCDDGCKKLADALGWRDEFDELMNANSGETDVGKKNPDDEKPEDNAKI